MAEIDMSVVLAILDEVGTLARDLDGIDLDETEHLKGGTKDTAHKRKAQRSNDLSFIADRLAMAEGLVRNEYWVARGRTDLMLLGDKSEPPEAPPPNGPSPTFSG